MEVSSKVEPLKKVKSNQEVDTSLHHKKQKIIMQRIGGTNHKMMMVKETTPESLEATDYEKNLRKLYYIDNVKRGLLNMEELNDALGKPLDNVSL